MQKQMLIQKNPEKARTKLSQALFLLQKQIQKLSMKEITILVSFISIATIGRVSLQWLPSVELITILSIIAGALFGKEEGFLVGSSSLIASNFFVYGGQGPWTIFQAIGFGIAGYLGGFLNENSKRISFVGVTLIATLIYETIMNAQSVMMFGFVGITNIFLLALPFTAVHLASNGIFAFFAPEITKKISEVNFFEQKKIAEYLRNYINSRLGALSKPK
jgi:uncharacterized membrane protein